VPISPGRTLRGANSTGPRLSNSGGLRLGPDRPPITWSTCEPTNRGRDRDASEPAKPTITAASSTDPPTVSGVRSKARLKLHRSSRIGAALATVPGGSATTTDIAVNAPSPSCTNAPSPSLICSRVHPSVEPNGPWKQAILVIGTGPSTRTRIRPMSCSQSVPIAFQ
jgi:hypothetical protein